MSKIEASSYATRRLHAFGAAVEAATHQSLQESQILLGPSRSTEGSSASTQSDTPRPDATQKRSESKAGR